MKNLVSGFEYFNDFFGFKWVFEGVEHSLIFEGRVIAVPLRSGGGVLVVEPGEFPDNAVILNGLGALVKRLQNPRQAQGAVCFCDAYYILDELNLIIAFPYYQMRCSIDDDGNIRGIYESR